MKTSINSSEQGQIIILIVVSIALMVALAALVVDGGNLYLNRRAAQTAADAAALAGAYERCAFKGNQTAVENAVYEYAINQNQATAIEEVVIADDRVDVTVSITTPTFFAKIFGKELETVVASAAADCLIPGGLKGDLAPIAWTCRPPVGEEVGDCAVERIPYDVFKEIQLEENLDQVILDVDTENTKTKESFTNDIGINNEGKALYIVMDTDQFNEQTDCQMYGGPVDCDLNNDGEIDIAAGGDRGWLYLEGNASDLDDVMKNGTIDEVTTNRWMPGKPGSDDVVVSVAKQYKTGEVVFIPVFDKICQTNDFYNDCDYTSPPDTAWVWKGKYTYYHVVEFAAFVITCVYDNAQDSCPGRTYAGLGTNDANTLEGYFLEDVVTGGLPGNGHDLGVYIVSLVE
jgi:hypothetical protein